MDYLDNIMQSSIQAKSIAISITFLVGSFSKACSTLVLGGGKYYGHYLKLSQYIFVLTTAVNSAMMIGRIPHSFFLYFGMALAACGVACEFMLFVVLYFKIGHELRLQEIQFKCQEIIYEMESALSLSDMQHLVNVDGFCAEKVQAPKPSKASKPRLVARYVLGNVVPVIICFGIDFASYGVIFLIFKSVLNY